MVLTVLRNTCDRDLDEFPGKASNFWRASYTERKREACLRIQVHFSEAQRSSLIDLSSRRTHLRDPRETSSKDKNSKKAREKKRGNIMQRRVPKQTSSDSRRHGLATPRFPESKEREQLLWFAFCRDLVN